MSCLLRGMLQNLYTNPYELSQINPFNMDCIHESGFAGSLFVDIIMKDKLLRDFKSSSTFNLLKKNLT